MNISRHDVYCDAFNVLILGPHTLKMNELEKVHE